MLKSIIYENLIQAMVLMEGEGQLDKEFEIKNYIELDNLDDFLEIKLDGCHPAFQVNGQFGDECRLYTTKNMLGKLQEGLAKLTIRRMGDLPIANNVNIFVLGFSGNISVLVGSSGTIMIGDCGQLNLDLRIGHDSLVILGDKTTSNGSRIVAINSNILIGKDVMFSDEVLIQGFDQHGIVDLKTRKIINDYRRTIIISEHTWIGRRVTLMPGITIGKGAIIGAAAVVTSDVSPCSLAAGVPARILKTNVSWARPWKHIDPDSAVFFDSLDIQ